MTRWLGLGLAALGLHACGGRLFGGHPVPSAVPGLRVVVGEDLAFGVGPFFAPTLTLDADSATRAEVAPWLRIRTHAAGPLRFALDYGRDGVVRGTAAVQERDMPVAPANEDLWAERGDIQTRNGVEGAVVIATPARWRQVWSEELRFSGRSGPLVQAPPLPAVDFGRQVVVLCVRMMGWHDDVPVATRWVPAAAPYLELVVTSMPPVGGAWPDTSSRRTYFYLVPRQEGGTRAVIR